MCVPEANLHALERDLIATIPHCKHLGKCNNVGKTAEDPAWWPYSRLADLKKGLLRKFNHAVKKMDFFFRIFSFGA